MNQMPSNVKRRRRNLVIHEYQEEAIKKALAGLQNDPHRVQVVSLPTGAGKTLVAIKVVSRFLQKYPKTHILWLAHRWHLLEQAVVRLNRIAPSLAEQSARIGSNATYLQDLPEIREARVHFTTLQTLYARFQIGSHLWLTDGSPRLVIIDECHWAADAPVGRYLLYQFLGKAKLLGLSATPAIHSPHFSVVAKKSYAELCPQYLAEPLIEEVATGIEWNPILEQGEISAKSLTEIASSEQRNLLIVERYLEGQGAGRYNRTLIFACNIPHANRLNQLLSRAGVACRVVHSQCKDEQIQDALIDFRRGRVVVLVSIGMLTEGYDVPAIDTIFLARPTASVTLLTQMIGRGARKKDAKDSFRIVEFNDSVTRLASNLFHAHNYFFPGSSPEQKRVANGGASCHAEPQDVPQFEALSLPGLEGVTFVKDQTFGVELEFKCRPEYLNYESKRWFKIAKKIIARLQDTAQLEVHEKPLNYHQNDSINKWRVCYEPTCGWEVISPILVNAEGFRELARVTQGLDELVKSSNRLRVNQDTGLHITLATRLDTQARMLGFIGRLTRLEAGLYSLVAPSRLYEFEGASNYYIRGRNYYCRPVREARVPYGKLSFRKLMQCVDRYHSVNLTKVSGRLRLLEVRMHQGTTNVMRIIPWIALWMHIFNHSRYSWSGNPEFGRVFPKGNAYISRNQAAREDIFLLLEREKIILPPKLESLLRKRRYDLQTLWEDAVYRRVTSWRIAGWYRR